MQTSSKRTIFIGDIHGCYNELIDLLAKVHYCPTKDHLISMGDLVHKGPYSHKVLEFFYESHAEVIMGNHDWHFLRALKDGRRMYKEGHEILSKTNLSKEQLIKWIEKFPYYIKGNGFIAVHGAFDPSKKKYSETDPHDMISGRYYDPQTETVLSSRKKAHAGVKAWYKAFPAKRTERTIIFGHWAQPEARFYKNFRCIDTGCCYGGNLSCLIWPDDKLVSVPSEQPKQFNY